MMRKFIVIADEPEAGIKNKVTNAISQAKAGYWHWFQNVWLISDSETDRNAVWWRDYLRPVFQSEYFIVFEETSGTWSGFGNKNIFEWMHQNWK